MNLKIKNFFLPFIPQNLLKNYNQKIESKKANIVLMHNKIANKPHQLSAMNIEILIHLSKDFKSSFGHVDLSLDDAIISYGPYDHNSNRLLGTTSDGVLVICDKQKYINHSVYCEDKVLISFKVDLSKEEINNIINNFSNITRYMYEWSPLLDLKNTQVTYKKHTNISDEYALYKNTDAKFFKFKNGKFKTYLVFKTNCVMFTNFILKNTHMQQPHSSTFMNPGAYYDFLDNQSTIIESTIYSKETLSQNNKLQ